MTKLTDIQLLVLSKAAAREDGLAVTPTNLNKASAIKVGKSLVARNLMRELRARQGMPVWREGTDGRPVSLMITRAGRDAIGVDGDETGIMATTIDASTGKNRASAKPLRRAVTQIGRAHV